MFVCGTNNKTCERKSVIIKIILLQNVKVLNNLFPFTHIQNTMGTELF